VPPKFPRVLERDFELHSDWLTRQQTREGHPHLHLLPSSAHRNAQRFLQIHHHDQQFLTRIVNPRLRPPIRYQPFQPCRNSRFFTSFIIKRLHLPVPLHNLQLPKPRISVLASLTTTKFHRIPRKATSATKKEVSSCHTKERRCCRRILHRRQLRKLQFGSNHESLTDNRQLAR